MDLGQYKLDSALRTIRSHEKSFALGTLYRGETFELHYITQADAYKGKWGWGHAYGKCNRWGWIELQKKNVLGKDIPAFDLKSHKPLKVAPKAHRIIHPTEFSLHRNGDPSHGTATNIDLTKGKHADRTKFVRLQGNRFSADFHYDLLLHDGAPVQWRYITHNELVMVNYQRSSTDTSRWGFVRLDQLRILKYSNGKTVY